MEPINCVFIGAGSLASFIVCSLIGYAAGTKARQVMLARDERHLKCLEDRYNEMEEEVGLLKKENKALKVELKTYKAVSFNKLMRKADELFAEAERSFDKW